MEDEKARKQDSKLHNLGQTLTVSYRHKGKLWAGRTDKPWREISGIVSSMTLLQGVV
jgi:hypothetical protein